MADREFNNINGIKVCDQTARNSIPTKTSQLTNDSDYATMTQVNQAIDNAQLGGGEVDLSGYVTKEVGNANQITFADGQTFQAKLDAGTLKGEKGDTGEQGIRGEKGDKGDKGDTGANGQDGLTTAISVNGNTYAHSNGIITLPNYPTVPTKTSELTNDSNYVTTVQMTDAINNASLGGTIDPITPVTYEWEIGGVTSTGELKAVTNRIRVVDYITFSKKTTFQSNNQNYVLRWYKYDTNKTFVEELGSWATKVEFEASADYVYRVAIRKTDDSDISTDVVSYFEIYTGTKETDNKNIKAFYNDYPNLFYPNKFKLEGHRGYSDKYPENTLLAFEEAGKRREYSGIETDVHRTSDGVFVLMHDSTIDRTTNGTGKPSAYTYEQLQAFYIDGGNGWDAKYANQLKIPKLTEYLAICRKYGKIPYIQVDQIESSYLGELIELLDKEGWKGRCVLTSFTLSDLTSVRAITDEYIFEYMISVSTADDPYTTALNTLSGYKNVIFRPDAASFLGKSNAQDFIYKFREAGILLECYGLPVGDTALLNKMLAFGIEGATCDSYVGFSDILGITNNGTVNTASDITIADTSNNFTATNVEEALAELFQFVSNGKTLIASAITDMGVATSNTDSFETMANKIKTIIGGTSEQPLYKFGLLSDAHIDGDGTDTAYSISDLNNAIQYFNNENCKFIVHCGDVTENGRSEDYTALKSCLATSSIPNYSVRGNHDMTNGYSEATGCADDYTITQNNDLFIFLSPSASSGTLSDEKLNWLENLLTTNTDKRVFFIYHFFFNNTAGNASNLDNGGLPSSDASVIRLKAMIESYSNLIFCNGHSHLRFSLQDSDPNANYYHEENKCYYVHVPSTSRPRGDNGSGGTTNIYGGSEGYLVEVYANKVIFKPIDFIANEYLSKYNYTVNVSQGANEPTIPTEPPESSSEVITPTWMNGGIEASTGKDFVDPEGMRSSYMEFDTNAYTYYITVTNEFEGINKLRVAIYNPDGSFVVRQSYTSTSLTPGVPGAISFPVTSGKFRLKVDFMTSNTLENINNRLVITKVAK